MPSIVTLTMNPALDVSTDVAAVEPDVKLRCGPPRLDPGGGGVNVARVVCRLGGAATAIYPCGGYTAEVFRALLAEETVNECPIAIAGTLRESFTADERSTGAQFRFVLEGPELSEIEWRRCLDALAERTGPDAYVVASGSLPRGVPVDFYARIARLAKGRGARPIVDAAGDAMKAALEEGVFAFKPNQREMEELTGVDLTEPSRQVEVVRAMVDSGRAGLVALTLSGDGALFAWRDGTVRVPAPRIVRRSAVGAGDSFLGGLVLKLAAGRPYPEAFRYAAAAGGSTLSTPGTELCEREHVERLFAELEATEEVGG